MNQILLKPLVQFKSHWQWLFVLGLFNSLILVTGFVLVSLWLVDLSMWVNPTLSCRCPPAPGMPFSKYVFPSAVKVSTFVSIFQVFGSLCLLETVYLTWKSHRFSTLSFVPVGINWFVRAVMKNLAGIFAILSCFAHPDYKIMYVGFIFISCALIIWCQTGQYRGYSFSFYDNDSAWTMTDVKRLFWSAVVYICILAILSGSIWVFLLIPFLILNAAPHMILPYLSGSVDGIGLVIFFVLYMIYRKLYNKGPLF